MFEELVTGIRDGLLNAAQFGAGKAVVEMQGQGLQRKLGKKPRVLDTDIRLLEQVARGYLEAILS